MDHLPHVVSVNVTCPDPLYTPDPDLAFRKIQSLQNPADKDKAALSDENRVAECLPIDSKERFEAELPSNFGSRTVNGVGGFQTEGQNVNGSHIA